MAQPKVQLPQAPDVEWQDAQFPFDGAWMPNSDASLIGPRNFATLTNLRYNDKSIEGVNGYSEFNTTALVDYDYIDNGIQLRTDRTPNSFTLVHAVDASGQGRIYQNTTAPGSQGDFITGQYGTSIIVDGGFEGYTGGSIPDWDFLEAAGSGININGPGAPTYLRSGSYSISPSNLSSGNCYAHQTIAVAPGQTFLLSIWTMGDGSVGGRYSVYDLTNSADIIPVTATGVTAFSFTEKTDSVVIPSGCYSISIRLWAPSAAGEATYDDISLKEDLSNYKFDISGNSYFADTSLNLKARFSFAPQSSVAYCNGEESMIYSGFENRIAAAFLQQDDATSYIKDVSEAMSSRLEDSYLTLPDGSFDELIILTTRPIQGIKFYVKTANAAAGAMTITYWDGDSWAAVANGSDGTDVGGDTLAQTGVYTFDHTNSVAKLKHYQELYLFAYKVTVAAGVSAEIYSLSVDPAFQPIQNVWDGVYRQPIQFQFYNASGPAYEDYTLQVNQSSDLNAPIGAQIDGMTTSDFIYIMFEEQMSAIRLTFLGGLVNKVNSVLTIKYWDGDSWVALTATDGTSSASKTFNQTGLIYWQPPTDEQKQTLFGSLGYAYQLSVSVQLTGTEGSTAEVLIDLCAGIPKLSEVGAFDFPIMYKNRLMLCGFSSSGEGNRMDFSAPSAPDVFNGTESSDNGNNSLYFGGTEKLTAASQLFNRFGASIFSMLIVFKDTETYLMTGDTVDEFQIYPVSTVVGCPAPLTVTTTELAPEGTENFARNFVLWLSHAGPLMFDGAVLAPIKGIENYFDPNKSEYINWTYAYKARAWIDPNYKEWNLIFPSGGSTEPDVWVAYDLQRKKWFRKDPSPAEMVLCGFNAMNPDTGEQLAYGGLDNGHVMQLENGTSWNGTGITQTVKTGDFWPTNNIWDLTLIRKFKIIAEKISSASSYALSIFYYPDTEVNPGQSVVFEDADVSSGIAVTFADTYTQVGGYDSDALVTTTEAVVFEDAETTSIDLTLDVGLQRVVRKTIDLNYLAFCHAFAFEVTTDDVQGGFRPVVWGIRFRRERADDTAS